MALSDSEKNKIRNAFDTLQGMSEAEAAKWIAKNSSQFSDEALYALTMGAADRQLVDDHFQVVREINKATGGTARWEKIQSSSGFELVDDVDLQAVARERVQSGLSGKSTSMDLDGDGTVEPSERDAVAKVKDEVVQQESAQRGVPEDQVAGEVDAALQASTVDRLPIPDTIRQYTGGVAPDRATVAKMIANWNEFNPDQPIAAGDVATLYRRLATNSPDTKGVLDATYWGIDPVQQYSIKLSNGSSVVVDADEFKTLQDVYGLQSADMTALIRSADRTGLTSSTGGSAHAVLAALTRAAGSVDVYQAPTAGAYMRPGTTVKVDVLDPKDGKQVYMRPGAGGILVDKPNRLKHSALDKLSVKFKEGQYIYQGNDTLAYIHTLNPTLAAKLAGDPKKLSQQDWGQFNQYLVDGKFDQKQLAAMGYYALGLEEYQNMNGRGSSGAPTRTIPDQDALRQAAKDMYRQLFAADPSDAELDSLVGAVNGAVQGAAENQDVSPEAVLRKNLEANGQYKDLYGKMPSGMTEAEYQNQFRAGAASMLGAEAADPTMIRAGMRSGEYQTTVGQAASSKKAWDNSTFMGRLASAAQVIAENT
jgi:hypothetical protein